MDGPPYAATKRERQGSHGTLRYVPRVPCRPGTVVSGSGAWEVGLTGHCNHVSAEPALPGQKDANGALIVWLWEAGSTSGVTNDVDRAQRNAESVMRGSGARTAGVEKAFYVLGVDSLTDSYQRAGLRWVAERDTKGRITWNRLAVL